MVCEGERGPRTRIGVSGWISTLVLCWVFREDHFSLFLIGRVILITLACLGLHLEFGAAGEVNFASAAFFGVGGYTTALLSAHTRIPHLLVLVAGVGGFALIGFF